jgi:hypothetical protein
LPASPEDDFYDLSSPAALQQGDIIPNAPLVRIPPSEHLVIVRDVQGNARIEAPTESTVKLVHEQAVDAFPDGEPEYAVVSAQRGMAMIVTQTCDLVDNQNWSVCPIYSLEGSEVNEGMLFSEDDWKQHYPTLFGLPEHPDKYFEPAHYVDLADIRSVYSGAVRLADRIASLQPLKQARLNDKMARMFSREWGHNAGETVPVNGKYRCNLCNRFFGIENPEIDLQAGTQFPACKNCTRLNKRPQWYLLQKHRKF